MIVTVLVKRARRILDLIKSKGEDAAHYLLQCVEHLGTPPAKVHEDSARLRYQKKLKSVMSTQSRLLSTYDGTENITLEDIYTNGVLEIPKNTTDSSCKQSSLELTDLFTCDGATNEDADTLLISGEAGSGKSTLLQQVHRLWGTSRVFQNFMFVFPFSCRRLSFIEKQVSLKSLLFEQCCWPDDQQEEIFQFILHHPEETLLTFDGLDEFKFRFTDLERHCSPTNSTSVQKIFFNLIQGNLMKNARKLVTSRPDAVTPVLKKYVQKEISLKGFSQTGIETFMKKYFRDPAMAERIILFVKTSPALHGLCHVPVYCWIVSKCHRELMQNSINFPQTMTDVYVLIFHHFLLHSVSNRQCATDLLQSKASMIQHLGKLALDGLVSCSYVFSERQLNEANLQKEDISAGFLVLNQSISQKSDDLSKHYEFLHITVQCFFAALYMAVNSNIGQSAIYSLFKYRKKTSLVITCMKPCFLSTEEHEGRIDKQLQNAERPNQEMTASFFAGLLSQRHKSFLGELCQDKDLIKKYEDAKKCLENGMQKHFHSIPTAVLEEKKSMHAMPEFVWLIKCIYEMQSEKLAKDAVSKLEVEHIKLTYCDIGPAECTALAYVLQHLRNAVGLQLDYNSVGDVGVEQLLPCLDVCQAIYLRNNNISDDGISKLVAKALHCQNFQKIALFNNRLTDGCTHCFADLLRTKKNFLALRLGNNHITAAGAEELAGGLKESNSIQFLGLWGNSIEDRGACAIAEALQNNKSLIWLSLVGNNIGSSGAQALALMIEMNRTLEDLCLEENRLKDQDVWYFAEALKKNSTLKVLKLANNKITKQGIQCLLEALKQNSTITSIWLRGNELTVSEAEEYSAMDTRLTF
nr:PREDICTED: nucleotide-binding oligomerization domain-containing protein 2 [Latimeria chalumnae]|eukprot:XP_006002351.1 PREDICTED: nucleotide-binding oligomerization domain-containing protein 2 [Latimeria chalumnae]